MTEEFVSAIEKEVAWKKTENGQTALNTTFDACLDLFSIIGSVRLRNDYDSDLVGKFVSAYSENPLLAIKIIFYARDIEEGLGERQTFKTCLRALAQRHPEDVKANLENIAKYGRFDDFYCLVETPVENDAFLYLKDVFNQDIKNCLEGKPITLLAKWLKSVNTSSWESRELGKLTAHHFGISESLYRKSVSKLRKYLVVLEQQMSANEWDLIDFSTVPGGAAKKYTQAFHRHQEERYKEYLEALKTGKTVTVKTADGKEKEVVAKINSKNLYPYEILEKYAKLGYESYRWYYDGRFVLGRYDYNEECEALWNGLKDWVNGVECNTIVVADTSGSMCGRPMATSVGLGIYFAERNTGPFHNRFMTFSSKPSWINLDEGSALCDKIAKVPGICESTNLEASFDLILNTALQHNLKPEDMPKNLVIITDMEFDSCVIDNTSPSGWYFGSTDMTFYDAMKLKYKQYGYELPQIVFWNVNARNDTYHTSAKTKNVRMVSGQATSVFKSLIDGTSWTPYDFMLETLNKERYNSVVLGK